MPPRINTYSLLTAQAEHSNKYYQEVAAFADKVIVEAKERVGRLLLDYQRWTKPPRSSEETILEILVLGVLWATYINSARSTPRPLLYALSKLTWLRQSRPRWKSTADRLRGQIMSIIYHPNTSRYPISRDFNVPKSLARLVAWLEATGEFGEEAKRLRAWNCFLYTQPEQTQEQILESILKLADWFSSASIDSLGHYSSHVEGFRSKVGAQHRGREDFLFCNRSRVEYHLNMVGAELLNRAYRTKFAAAKRKIVLLPACMRWRGANCPATKTAIGYRCIGCSSQCPAKTAASAASRYGLETAIIPHESMLFSSEARQDMLGENVGIVGVACLLHLIPGGWKAEALGIPAQCVLLDYCGCKHWDEEGICTTINLEKLEQIASA